MNKLGHDPWRDAIVWYATAGDKPWIAGVVKSNHEVSRGSDERLFVIESLDEERSATAIAEVVSRPVDSFGLEYHLVKKRDPSAAASTTVTDMTALSFLNEPEMIQCLKMRYAAKHIYTNIGPILVAVNPFERLAEDVYSAATIDKYSEADAAESRRVGPHVFQISNNAYNRMFIDKYDPDKRENQSILVNGESGAGKTESTKQVLKFLASNSASVAASLENVDLTVDVERVITAINPITESFGNAKTSRNNNSSRFGKFIELEYVADGYIASSHIQTYLLETVRVTSQLKGERNYHIFYELFAGMSESQRVEWNCKALQDFRLVNQSGEYNRYDGESDSNNFSRLVNAFQTIEMCIPAMEEIFKTVIGILHIGNLSLVATAQVGTDAADFSSECRPHVESACQLLGIPEARLVDAISTRCIKVAGNLIKKQLNSEMATAARDVLAKTTYELLFKSIMIEVNQSLQFTDEAFDCVSFIGVLDIFGFEYFEHNSFEQLCINYANEKLQDHFNYAIFQSEKEVYEEEGVKWNFTDYPDNSERLELFEHKATGLFLLCDEQLKIPKPSDEKLIQSFYAKCTSYRHFSASKSHRGKMEFVINHFACDVKYTAAGFVDKNRNEIAQEIFDCYQSSSVAFIQQFSQVAGVDTHHTPHRKRSLRDSGDGALREERSSSVAKPGHSHQISVRKKTSSLASQFSRQLYELISKIRSTRSHFVRCIKPNNQLLANTFNYEMVMNQLRCGGALGAVQVFRAGFPNRMDFKFFVSRYSAFLVLCGVNALTKDLYECLVKARESGSDELWKLSASMLVDIVSMTIVILNMSEEAEISGDTNILSGLQMGKTQMFLRVPVFELLERLHVRSMNIIAKRLQRRVRSKISILKNGKGARFMAGQSIMCSAFHRRVIARKCVSATLVLQRRVRVFLAQSRRRRAIRGLNRLKALYRGYKARERVKLIKFKAAVKIQANYRCFFSRKLFLKQRSSIIAIQTFSRKTCAVIAKKTKLHLILNLQCLWRGTQARIRTWAIRQKLKQAQQAAKQRAAEAKADFMNNLDDKLKSNPNLLFDMLGASEKISVLTRQNELLMQRNKQLEKENIDLSRAFNAAQQQIEVCLSAPPSILATNSNVVDTSISAPMLSPANNKPAHSSQVAPSKPLVHETSTALKIDSNGPATPNTEQQKRPILSPSASICLVPEGSTPKASLLIYARDSAGAIYKLLGAAKDRKSQLSSELSNSQKENGNLTRTMQELAEKKAAATIKIERLGSYLSEPKDDTSAQLLAVDNQIQIMQKRKATLIKLLSNLQADRSTFFEADINGAMDALNDIDTKLAELCAQQQKLSQAPIHFTELTHASEKDCVDKAVEDVQSLEASVSFLTEEIKMISQQQTLAELNVREVKLKYADAVDDCNVLEADLHMLQEIIARLDASTGPKISSSSFKASSVPSASSTDLITDKVKEKLSSVRGIMGRMSFGGFTSRIGSGSFLTPEKEQVVTSPFGKEAVTEGTSTLDISDFVADVVVAAKEKWNPDFIGSVGAWARSGKRDVTFIISVRAVESGAVAEWTVTRTFNDFKALRQSLNAISTAIDNSFPSDSLYSMFTISNETADLRKEDLNTYLLSLCGCEEAMVAVENAKLIRDFLRVDEYMKQNFADVMHV